MLSWITSYIQSCFLVCVLSCSAAPRHAVLLSDDLLISAALVPMRRYVICTFPENYARTRHLTYGVRKNQLAS
jgi:hypothetical protein